VTFDENRHRNTTRRVLRGKRRDVLHINRERLWSAEPSQTSLPSLPSLRDDRSRGYPPAWDGSVGRSGAHLDQNRPTRTSHSDLGSSAYGSKGPEGTFGTVPGEDTHRTHTPDDDVEEGVI
jgi:hypothetical protein